MGWVAAPGRERCAVASSIARTKGGDDSGPHPAPNEARRSGRSWVGCQADLFGERIDRRGVRKFRSGMGR